MHAHAERRSAGRTIAREIVLAVVIAIACFPFFGAGRVDWAPMLEQLRERPDQQELTELVHEILSRFEEDTTLLNPARTILGCLGGGCLQPVLLTPPSQLVAGRTRSGPSRSYNSGSIVGLIGVFGDTIARGVNGFFLLRTTPEGSIQLIDVAGEEVASLTAIHADQVSVTPIPIPDPERGSQLLPERVLEGPLRVDAPDAWIVVDERAALILTVGHTDQADLFSGIIVLGTSPQP